MLECLYTLLKPWIFTFKWKSMLKHYYLFQNTGNIFLVWKLISCERVYLCTNFSVYLTCKYDLIALKNFLLLTSIFHQNKIRSHHSGKGDKIKTNPLASPSQTQKKMSWKFEKENLSLAHIIQPCFPWHRQINWLWPNRAHQTQLHKLVLSKSKEVYIHHTCTSQSYSIIFFTAAVGTYLTWLSYLQKKILV